MDRDAGQDERYRQAAADFGPALERLARGYERDPHLRDRGFYRTIDHAELGPLAFEGLPIHFERGEPKIDRPAPLHGEHNEYVFQQLLGLSDEEFADCVAEGVI